MATKENAPKKEKAPIVLDSQIVKNYREMVKNSTASHWGFIESTYSKMELGEASVRIAKASINEASKEGKDTIIKASQVEGFGIALKVRNLIGADKQPIASVLKVSMRAKRIDGVDSVDSLLSGIKTWEGFLNRLEEAEDIKAEAEEAEEAKAEADKAEAELDPQGITWEALAEILIKKASKSDMRTATIDPKIGGQGLAILNQLVKNAKAISKVNA